MSPGFLRRHRWVIAAILVGLTIRYAIVIAFPEMYVYGDEIDFIAGARALATGQPVPCFPNRPPMFVAFGALMLRLFGPSVDAIRYGQITLEALTMIGLVALARRTLGARVATAAAWIYALYPDFIAYSHYLWSETFAAALLVWSLLLLLLLHERPGWRRALPGGLVWGALMLTKPYELYMLPLLLGWVLFASPAERRGALLRASLLLFAVSMLFVVPWSIHASRLAGKPMVICELGEKTLRLGVNKTPPPQVDFASEWFVPRRRRLAHPAPERDVGLLTFIAQEPGLFVSRAVQKLSYLWSPNSFLIRAIYMDAPGRDMAKYVRPGELPAWLRLGLVYMALGSTALLSLLFVIGLGLSRSRFLAGLTGTFCLATMAMITLTPSFSRYRLPMMLFATLYAGVVLAGRADRSLWARRSPWIFGGVLFLLAMWGMRLPAILIAAW